MPASPWARFSADPRTSGTLRATDADRDVLLDLLRDAYADGRLDREEHAARAEEALRARLLADCVPLLADLVPVDAPTPGTPVPVAQEARVAYARERRDARNGWVGITVLTTGIWGATSLASGEPLFFWPVFPSLGVGLGYLGAVLGRESRLEKLEEEAAQRRRRRSDGPAG